MEWRAQGRAFAGTRRRCIPARPRSLRRFAGPFAIAVAGAVAGAAALFAPGGAVSAAQAASPGDNLAGLVTRHAPLPGATVVGNGPLAPATFASFAPGDAVVRRTYDRDAARAGFAAWVRTWRAPAAGEEATDMAIRLPDPGAAATLASQVAVAVGRSAGAGPAFGVAGVPGALGHRVDIPGAAGPAGGGPPVTSQVVVVVFRLASEAAVVSVDAAGDRPGASAIETAQAVALAQDQYRRLAAAVALPTTGRFPVLVVVAAGILALLVPAGEAARRRHAAPRPR